MTERLLSVDDGVEGYQGVWIGKTLITTVAPGLAAEARAELDRLYAAADPASSVWQRMLVTIPELCRDPDWPLKRAATYELAKKGEIPTRRVGTNVFVVMPELIAKMHLEKAVAA